jgi:hypothetical protein
MRGVNMLGLASQPTNATRNALRFVIPAKAGIQRLDERQRHWVPAFAGMTASGAFNFKERFDAMAELSNGFSVRRIFPNSNGRRLDWRLNDAAVCFP